MNKQLEQQKPLRSAAKARLARLPLPLAPARSPEELLHELQVHQIELEMQNEELRQSQLSLEESRDHYANFYDFAPVGYLTLTDKGLISEINLTGAKLLGIERSKLLNQRLAQFVAPEDSDRWHRHFQTALKQNEKQTCEMVFKFGNDSKFHAQLDCLHLYCGDNEPEVRIVLTDITERKQMEAIMREQEEFFRMIAENTDDFITVLGLDGKQLYNSPSYAKLLGDTESMKNAAFFAWIHPDDREHVKWLFMETVQSGTAMKADYRFVLPDGSIRHMESRGGLIRDNQGKALRVVVVSRDVTARMQIEEEIHHLAFYDLLTKLPNRRLMNDRLAQAMTASKRSSRYCAMMFIDLDNFKPLNDRCGHATGDLLLVEAARRISKCVRAMDTVSRFGGDEFVVILSELDTGKEDSIVGASFIAEKIRFALAEPYSLTIHKKGNKETTLVHHCTSSIGVALFTNKESNADDILKWADLAMYQAKNGGCNQIQFFDQNAQVESH